MDTKDLAKELEKIKKQIDALQKRINYSQKPLTPFQAAVKTATNKNSSDSDVKDALNTFVESPDQMTINQFAFVIYFLAINKKHLSDDINWWCGIELGKHRYNERDTFIDGVNKVLGQKYRSNQTVCDKIQNYLSSLKRK